MAVSARPVPILADNYAWLIRDDVTGAVALVDPAEQAPIVQAIEDEGGRLDLILLTHHHDDHIAAALPLKARFGARLVGAKADAHRLPPLDLAVAENDEVVLGGAFARVIETPGHTRGHVAYFFQDGPVIACGDTLFSLGCGRLFEGTPAELFASLQKLAALPRDTLVCCGHEYTDSNARFALHVDPGNEALQGRAEAVRALRARGLPTVPTRIGDELEQNPFLRAPDSGTLGALRTQKDQFRG